MKRENMACAPQYEAKAEGCLTEVTPNMIVKGCAYEHDLRKLNVTGVWLKNGGCRSLQGHADWYYCFCKPDNCNTLEKHRMRPHKTIITTSTKPLSSSESEIEETTELTTDTENGNDEDTTKKEKIIEEPINSANFCKLSLDPMFPLVAAFYLRKAL